MSADQIPEALLARWRGNGIAAHQKATLYSQLPCCQCGRIGAGVCGYTCCTIMLPHRCVICTSNANFLSFTQRGAV